MQRSFYKIENILKQCNDIECNPRPCRTPSPSQPLKQDNFVIGHVNIRCIKAPVSDPDFGNTKNPLTKMDLLKNEMTFRNYSILSISETWLDDSYDADKLTVQ